MGEDLPVIYSRILKSITTRVAPVSSPSEYFKFQISTCSRRGDTSIGLGNALVLANSRDYIVHAEYIVLRN